MARLRHRIEIIQQIQNGKARNAIIAKPIEKEEIEVGFRFSLQHKRAFLERALVLHFEQNLNSPEIKGGTSFHSGGVW